MIYYKITTVFKDKKSINNFFSLFFYNIRGIKRNIIKKYLKNKNKKIPLTILKSPHVNKTAQEQFELRKYRKQLQLLSTQTKHILLLKKIQLHLFPEINVKIKFILNQQTNEKLLVKVFDPDNYKINGKYSFQKTSIILDIFTTYGELID